METRDQPGYPQTGKPLAKGFPMCVLGWQHLSSCLSSIQSPGEWWVGGWTHYNVPATKSASDLQMEVNECCKFVLN